MNAQIIALASAAVPLVVRFLQNASAKDEAVAKAHAEQLATSKEIMGRVTGQVSSLLFYFEEVLYGAVFDRKGNAVHIAEDEKSWAVYSALLVDWKRNRITGFASIEQYFGQDAARLFLEINSCINALERRINARHYNRPQSKYYIEDVEGGENDFRVKFVPIHKVAVQKAGALTSDMVETCSTLALALTKPDRFIGLSGLLT